MLAFDAWKLDLNLVELVVAMQKAHPGHTKTGPNAHVHSVYLAHC